MCQVTLAKTLVWPVGSEAEACFFRKMKATVFRVQSLETVCCRQVAYGQPKDIMKTFWTKQMEGSKLWSSVVVILSLCVCW